MKEKKVDQSDAVLDAVISIPKFFKLSFEIWIDINSEIKTYENIFHATNDINNNYCGSNWPLTEVEIQSGNKFDLRHTFNCFDVEKSKYGHKYKGNEGLTTQKWHHVEYQQLPVELNEEETSSLAEMIIRINHKTTHKIANQFPKRYDNMKIYYGLSPDKDILNTESISAKIRNFKLSELLQGETYFTNDSLIPSTII